MKFLLLSITLLTMSSVFSIEIIDDCAITNAHYVSGYKLGIEIQKESAPWWSNASEYLYLEFVSRQECKKQKDRLGRDLNLENVKICSCSADKIKNDYYKYFSRMNCIEFKNSRSARYTIPTRSVFISNYESTKDFDYEYHFQAGELKSYLDIKKDGKNHQNCMKELNLELYR